MKIEYTAKIINVGGAGRLVISPPPETIMEARAKLCSTALKSRGGFVTVSISLPRRPRSTGERSQNHHLNGHIQQIAADTGNDFSAVKRVVKHRSVSMGYPADLDERGNIVIGIDGLINAKSEADASVDECRILIDCTHMLAAELSITLEETDA